MSKKFFHFTVGPVQGFVAQARRTRDLWAGSYLLSYLSGVAMHAISSTGEEIVFPRVKDDPLFRAIAGIEKPTTKEALAARTGSLPNRYKAKVDDATTASIIAINTLNKEWQKIADTAWRKIEAEAGSSGCPTTADTRAMWDRHIKHHWEIAWVAEDDSVFLDQRKNLRSHFPPEEPGEKCTLCGERQALSPSSTDGPAAVKKWWEALSGQFNKRTGRHFLSGGVERLCGICTIKRTFPLVSQDAIGWEVIQNYPSTACLASIDWIKLMLKKAQDDPAVKEALKVFIDTAKKAKVPKDETATTIPGICKILAAHPDWKPIADFSGDVFFPDAVKNEKEFPVNKEYRRGLLDALKKLTKAVGEPPSPFYAVLIMDGDNMGRLLSENSDKQIEISMAISEFNGKVAGIVEEENDGKIVYAGGEDVFALLPLDSALRCAKQLRESYLSSFRKHVPSILDKGDGTLSAGIVYAHMNTSLQAIVRDANLLLKKTAKDDYGRNAFAVRIWKRGGPILTFGKKWAERDWVDEIDYLKDAYVREEYSSGFFYRIGELKPILDVMNPNERIQLLTAEYLKSRDNLGLPEDQEKRQKMAEERIRRFEGLCKVTVDGIETLTSEGPLFIKFLADKEAGR